MSSQEQLNDYYQHEHHQHALLAHHYRHLQLSQQQVFMNSNPNTPQRPQQHSEYNPYFMPYMPSPFPAPRVSRSQTERQSVNNYLQRYKPYQRPPRRSLGAELAPHVPHFETASYETAKLIDNGDDDNDVIMDKSDVGDNNKTVNKSSTDGLDDRRKSGDGESASTTTHDGAYSDKDVDNVEYHSKLTFKLEPNVFSPKHNQVPG